MSAIHQDMSVAMFMAEPLFTALDMFTALRTERSIIHARQRGDSVSVTILIQVTGVSDLATQVADGL